MSYPCVRHGIGYGRWASDGSGHGRWVSDGIGHGRWVSDGIGYGRWVSGSRQRSDMSVGPLMSDGRGGGGGGIACADSVPGGAAAMEQAIVAARAYGSQANATGKCSRQVAADKCNR